MELCEVSHAIFFKVLGEEAQFQVLSLQQIIRKYSKIPFFIYWSVSFLPVKRGCHRMSLPES